MLGIGSCNKNDNDTNCSVAWATELQVQINAITSAAQAYANTPNATTCNAYKAACQAYVDALEPYGTCSTLTTQQKA